MIVALRALLSAILRQADVLIGTALVLIGISLRFSVADAMIVAGIVLFVFAVFGGRISKWGS